MDITRITPANSEYFEELVPDGGFEDEELVWLGAVAEDGAACAVLGGGIQEGMGFIDWIYTAPEYREKGAADSLLKVFSTLLKRMGKEAIEISFSDMDDELYGFLEAEEFLVFEDSCRYSVPLSDLIYSEVIEEPEGGRDSLYKVISAAGFADPRPLFDYLTEKNIPCSVNKDELGKHSLILLDNEDKIKGCMMVVKGPDGDVQIPYLVNEGPMECVTDLFLALKNLIIEKGWEEENLVFSDRAGRMIEFVEQITDEDRDKYVISGLRDGIRFLAA